MLILDVSNVSKNFGFDPLFEGLSFSLNEGERISIIGPNGCGKSTLLKMIAGIEKVDSGSISIRKDASVAYLDQTSPDKESDKLVIDILKEAFSDLIETQNQIDSILKKLETETDPDETDRLLRNYSRLFEKLQDEGGYEIDTKIEIVVNGLNIPKEMLQQNYNNLSGGEKTLIHLAKALLLKPNLFLLDEPTNHLDINRIEWLESYIKSFKGSVVIVSHDRYFLDKMSNKILEIDNGEAKVYNTNYSGYLEEKERNFQKQMENYKDQQAYFKRIEDQIKFFMERGMATNSSTLTKKAAVLQNRLEREKAKSIKRPKEQKNLKIEFNEIQKSSKRILEVSDLVIKSPQKTILDGVNLHIAKRERVALVGNNGSGKSTFIKALLQKLDLPYSGDIVVSQTIKIGYLPQVINFKDDKLSLLEYFQLETGINEQKSRAILSSFQFNKVDIQKRVGNLSGGERIRLKLSILLQQQVNMLIFDEPTNHIDIPTKETLEEAINDFEGTFLFVSHDRYFINKFAHRVVEFENGKMTNFLGNYEDYKKSKQK